MISEDYIEKGSDTEELEIVPQHQTDSPRILIDRAEYRASHPHPE